MPLTKATILGFATKWSKCQLCAIGREAYTHVLYRDSCHTGNPDVCFIGEAPGSAENATGQPFIGRAGKVLDQLLHDVSEDLNYLFSYSITNTVCCFPRDRAADSPDAFREPTPEEVKTCSPRLKEFLELINPKTIVLLGKVAQKGFRTNFPDYPAPLLDLYHPSYILRQGWLQGKNFTSRPSEAHAHVYVRTKLQLVNFLREYVKPRKRELRKSKDR